MSSVSSINVATRVQKSTEVDRRLARRLRRTFMESFVESIEATVLVFEKLNRLHEFHGVRAQEGSRYFVGGTLNQARISKGTGTRSCSDDC